MAVAKNLVIVESPGKVKTISRYLGSDFKVKASFGHVRDLPKSKMGIDMEKNYEPIYQIPKDKAKVVKDLADKIGKSTTVWIATDEDREGEAIGWHLVKALEAETKAKDVKRIVFHEITKPAILNAVENPRELKMNLVNAQQARRVLDRLVGYELSPLLWKKIKFGLSAGRVQSVALRIIVDREREIDAFEPDEYWSIVAQMTPEKGDQAFEAKLTKLEGEAIKPTSEKEATVVLDALKGADYTVTKVEKKEAKRNPAAPFITSTLQQEASRKLGFSVKKTMMVAQKLYEGIDIDGEHEGLITYMRTDSTNLSDTATKQAKEVVTKLYGKEFALDAPRTFKSKKGAQEAHEAIRPTDLSRTPESMEGHLKKDEFRLYELIWKRTLACQMEQAIFDKVGVNIEAKGYTFRATGQTIKFAGFMQVYLEGRDDEEEDDDRENFLPELKEGEHPKLKELVPTQHFTKPPPRYTEASLVKKLESEGIGRPSTYSPTISTVISRGYVEKEDRTLRPTDMGEIVCDFLVEHFPKIVDLHFTVRMEEMLDEVEEGKETWQQEIKEFYEPFHKLVQTKEETVTKAEATQARDLGVDPKSGKVVSVRVGRYGPFVQMGDKEDEEKPKFASLPETLDRNEVTLDDVLYLFQLPRKLGKAKGDEDVIVNIGRYGPYVQIGKTYYSLKEDDPYSVDLKRALEVVEEEKERKAKAVLHRFEEEDITVQIGPYGPYVKQGKKNYKIPKTMEAEKLTLKDCLKIIEEAPAKKKRYSKKK